MDKNVTYVNEVVKNKMDNTSMLTPNQIPNDCIDENKITDSLRQMINGNAPTRETIDDKSITTNKLTFIADKNIYVNRPFIASITGSGTSSVLTINFPMNTIWYANSSDVTGWRKVELVNVTKTIGHGQRLVLDWDNQTINVETYSNQHNPRFIILAQNSEGFITGELSYYINDYLESVKLYGENKLSFVTNVELYVNRDFKANTNGEGVSNILTLNFPSNMIWYSQSESGFGWRSVSLVDKTFTIPHNNRLILNVDTKEIIVETNTNVLNSRCILLLQNTEGYLVGKLAAYVYNYLLKNDVKNIIDDRPVYEENLIDKVTNTHVLKQSSNDFSMAVIADVQGNVDSGYNSYLHHYESLIRTIKKVGVDCIAEMGDVVMGNNTKEITSNLLTNTSNILNCGLAPVFRVRGNHDDNSWIAHTQKNQALRITDKEWYSRILKPFEKYFDNVNTENKGYYYKDFEKQKIRVITLDCEDLPYIENGDGTVKYPQIYRFGYQQRQLQWLCEKALNFTNKEDRKEWGVVLLNHQWRQIITDDGKHFNDAQLVHILKAFKSGTRVQTASSYEDMSVTIDYDFTSQGAMEIICGIGGDSHVDNFYELGSSGIKIIEVLCSLPQAEPNMPSRTLKTESEDAWDLISINREERKIYCTRFGAGTDREFSY